MSLAFDGGFFLVGVFVLFASTSSKRLWWSRLGQAVSFMAGMALHVLNSRFRSLAACWLNKEPS